MINSPWETKSDSFYFVENKLIMHNKAEFSYAPYWNENLLIFLKYLKVFLLNKKDFNFIISNKHLRYWKTYKSKQFVICEPCTGGIFCVKIWRKRIHILPVQLISFYLCLIWLFICFVIHSFVHFHFFRLSGNIYSKRNLSWRFCWKLRSIYWWNLVLKFNLFLPVHLNAMKKKYLTNVLVWSVHQGKIMIISKRSLMKVSMCEILIKKNLLWKVN